MFQTPAPLPGRISVKLSTHGENLLLDSLPPDRGWRGKITPPPKLVHPTRAQLKKFLPVKISKPRRVLALVLSFRALFQEVHAKLS